MFSKVEELYISLITGFTLILFVSSVFILSIVRYRRKTLIYQSEKQAMENLHQQALLKTQIEIQSQTLKTISQEIHDNVGQVLSLAKLNLATIENVESLINQTKINDTKQLVSKAIVDLRNLSHSLHGDVIAEISLQQSIANELKLIENTRMFETALLVEGSPVKIDVQKKMILFRIVQEALNNCIKYSEAKKIIVTLKYQPQFFTLQIQDNGKGFNVHKNTGIGMKSMLNRAQLIGGSFNLESIEGAGTTVTIDMPC